MTTEDVLKALERYKEGSPESDRQTATKLCIHPKTLSPISPLTGDLCRNGPAEFRKYPLFLHRANFWDCICLRFQRKRFPVIFS
jgi:hypothetical protein